MVGGGVGGMRWWRRQKLAVAKVARDGGGVSVSEGYVDVGGRRW